MTGKFAKIGSFFLSEDGLDDALLSEDACHRFSLSPGNLSVKGGSSLQKAVIEIFLPRGGHYLSGLLGLRFTPTDDEEILVQVNYGETNRSIRSHLVAQCELNVGLDKSFVSAVEKGIRRNLDCLNLLGGGVLSVDTAAQNLGSSEYVFETLASVLCSIISGSVPVEKISELLEKELFPRR